MAPTAAAVGEIRRRPTGSLHNFFLWVDLLKPSASCNTISSTLEIGLVNNLLYFVSFRVRNVTSNYSMKDQFPRAVQANVSAHEMQAQVAHTVQTNVPAYMPFSGGVREHHVDFAPEVNQGRFPSSLQTNASTHAPFSGGVGEQQVHFTQPNQFTGGQQHDLQSMVLEVMQQPDILALENGVHVDEVARRLGMPRAQIMAIAQRLVDLACLYSTIDDYHFKSLLNG
ncbi:Replication protein A 32 kDa subunit A [Zea mays]|uniref:Replication protein A 32 kDa subunit A n=1 Tax=Zea mays TaxID=4577 RepID=A0A1D6GUD4_MAIZE|nr:Replication protein A 32 kDa subunit A [Zea mays]